MSLTRRVAQILLVLLFTTSGPGWGQSVDELFEQGEGLRKAGRYEQAIELFDQVLEIDHDHSEAYRKRGLCRRDLGDFDRAFADYEQAVAADPGNPEAYRSYAIALQRLDQHREAIEWCDRGIAVAETANLHIARSLSRRELGDVEGAVEDTSRAIDLEPDNAYAWMHRGLNHYRAKEYRKALADYDRAIELSPSMSSAYHNRCTTDIKLERYDAAISDAERSIALGNSDPVVYRLLGNARRLDGDLRGAMKAYDEAIDRNPVEKDSLFYRGWTRMELGDLEGAIADNSRVIELQPANKQAWNNRGSAHQKHGDLEAALGDFTNALRLDPEYQLARDNQKIVEKKLRIAGKQPPTSGPGGPSPGAPQPGELETGKPAIPDIVFSASDPCAAAAASSEGLPWQEVSGPAPELPADVAAATLNPPLALESMSTAQYAGAVSVAKEGMRLLYGVLPPDQALQFEKVWAPMFTNPTRESVAYLNQLNPLIGQFLAGREALIRAGAALQTAVFEAALAVETDLPNAWADAMAMADLQTRTITSLEAGLVETARRIHELGNPPNPQAARCEALRRYRRSFPRDESRSPIDGVWSDAEGNWLSVTHRDLARAGHVADLRGRPGVHGVDRAPARGRLRRLEGGPDRDRGPGRRGGLPPRARHRRHARGRRAAAGRFGAGDPDPGGDARRHGRGLVVRQRRSRRPHVGQHSARVLRTGSPVAAGPTVARRAPRALPVLPARPGVRAFPRPPARVHGRRGR